MPHWSWKFAKELSQSNSPEGLPCRLEDLDLHPVQSGIDGTRDLFEKPNTPEHSSLQDRCRMVTLAPLKTFFEQP